MVTEHCVNTMKTVPDFISPPGDTIADLLEDLSMTPTELAHRLGYTLESIKLLLAGKASITREVALKLEMLGSTAEFWLRREAIYQTELVRHGVEVDCQLLVAQSEEDWRPIRGHDGYSVSTLGRVRSEKRWIPCSSGAVNYYKGGKLRKLHVDNLGHVVVGLGKGVKGDKYTMNLVSRLVALAFIPNPENKPSVYHLDGNQTNNRVENLVWATQKEIVERCKSRGTFTCAGKGFNCKVKPDEVATIRELVSQGLTRPMVAKMVGRGIRTVRKYTKDLP